MAATETRRLELALGAFLLLGLLLVGGMVLLFGRHGGLFADTFKVIVDIEHVGNLRPGAPVKLGGFPVGQVADIRLAKQHLEVELDLDATRVLPKDTVATIANAGLVGDTFLEVTLGRDPAPLPQTDDPAAAPHIRGEGPVQMSLLFKQVQEIGVTLASITRSLDEVVGDESFKRNTRESMANINATSLEAKRFMVSLNKMSENIQTATESAKSLVATLDAAVQRTAGNPQNVEAINASIADFAKVGRNLGSRSEQLGPILDNLRLLSDKGAEIARKLDPDKGLLRLITGDSMQAQVTTVLEGVQSSVRRVNAYLETGLVDLLADNKAADRISQQWFRQNEKRYRTPEELMAAWKQWSVKQRQLTGHLPDPGPTE